MALYHDARTILTNLSIPRVQRQTHYHTHKPSAPAQIINYLSTLLHNYFDIKSFLYGPSISIHGFNNNVGLNHTLINDRDRAVQYLEESASLGNPDAMYLLGDLNFYGNYSYSRNFSTALAYYHQLSDLNGNASAQFMLGLGYSTGLFGLVPVDQARASLYYTFAAEGGDLRAKMAMGFRYLAAIGAERDIDKAIYYYRDVADKAVQYYTRGPGPFGNKHLCRSSWIIADEVNGGMYGYGASGYSSGVSAKENNVYPSGVNSFEEALEYFLYMSDDSDSIAADYALALLYYVGGTNCQSDYKKSVEYARSCMRKLFPSGEVDEKLIPESDFKAITGACAGILGRRYLRGEGVDHDFEKALAWFKIGAIADDREAIYALGMMHLKGIATEKNVNVGVELLRTAAVDITFAQMYLAKYHLEIGDSVNAQALINRAADSGSTEAMFYKANFLVDNDQMVKSYDDAVILYKQVSERVEELHSPLRWAQEKYREGDLESAALGFLIGAEQGYESAQMNVAYLLDDHRGYVQLDESSSLNPLWAFFPNVSRTALSYWIRSSKQRNIDAHLKMGDYYLNGIGIEPDAEKAAACYNLVADMGNPQARWNLGWMYENGIGVEKDFHLAKRYYDLVLDVGPEAFLTVKLSLLKLYVKSYWNSLTGGISINDEDEQEPLSLWGMWNGYWKLWLDIVKRFFEYIVEQFELEAQEFEKELEQKKIKESRSSIFNDDFFEQAAVDESFDWSMILTTVVVIGIAFAWLRTRNQPRNHNQNNNHHERNEQN